MKKVGPPVSDKTKNRIAVYFWGFALLPFFAVSALFLFQSENSLPPVSMMDNPPEMQASIIIGAQGDTMGRYWKVNRTSAKYQDISPYVFDALVSTEDERFHEHSGIDFKSLLRSFSSLGGAGGASTISQQLAKLLFTIEARRRNNTSESNVVLGKLQRLNEKARENIIAVRLESRYTKEEILTMYLNQFDFLYNAVGIENASKAYFNKLPINLSKTEAALLVGMCKNPGLYNPYSFKKKNYAVIAKGKKDLGGDTQQEWCINERKKDSTRALQRRNQVLFQWLKNSERGNISLKYKITKKEYDSLCMQPIITDYQVVDHKEGLAPYFKEALRKEITELFNTKNENGRLKYMREDGIPYDVYNDGLKIYTTIDCRLQKHAEKAVEEHIKTTLQPAFNKNNTGLNNYPFSNSVNKAQVDLIMQNARKSTPRYKFLIGQGYTNDQITENFNTPTQMSVFSWRGEIDTVMSPNDSIRYYKAFLHAGLVSIDPKTGFVKAWVGGVNFKHFAYDHVRLGKRQVGSTIKPFVYAAALEAGVVSPNTTFSSGDYGIDIINELGQKAGRYSPRGSAAGSVTSGLTYSSNPTTVAVMAKMGPHDPTNKSGGPYQINSLLSKLGINIDPKDVVPPMCLGSMDLSLFELVSAQCVFPNNGVYVGATAIERIEDRNGRVIYEAGGQEIQALNSTTTYEIIKMMKGVVDKGTGRGLRGGKYGKIPPTAGKTGTTQNNSDGWFIGITPNMVTGVWVGAEDRSVRFKSTGIGQGARVALPIYGLYMQRVYKDPNIGYSILDFEEPPDYNPKEAASAQTVSAAVTYEFKDTLFDW